MTEPAPEIAAQEAAIAAGQDDAPVEAPEAPAEDEATVAVELPFYVDSFVASDTLTVDRLGVKVPRADTDELVLKAAASGITLKVT